MSVSLGPGREATRTCFYCRHYRDLICQVAKRRKAPDAPACERFFRPKTLEEFVGGAKSHK